MCDKCNKIQQERDEWRGKYEYERQAHCPCCADATAKLASVQKERDNLRAQLEREKGERERLNGEVAELKKPMGIDWLVQQQQAVNDGLHKRLLAAEGRAEQAESALAAALEEVDYWKKCSAVNNQEAVDFANKVRSIIGANKNAPWSELITLLAAQSSAKGEVGWISVEDSLPAAESYVLAFFVNEYGKPRRIRAFYAPRYTVATGVDNDWYECKDGDDEAYLPEGWYECNEYEETHWHVTDRVTHWMPLPEAPDVIRAEANQPAQGEGGEP